MSNAMVQWLAEGKARSVRIRTHKDGIRVDLCLGVEAIAGDTGSDIDEAFKRAIPQYLEGLEHKRIEKLVHLRYEKDKLMERLDEVRLEMKNINEEN